MCTMCVCRESKGGCGRSVAVTKCDGKKSVRIFRAFLCPFLHAGFPKAAAEASFASQAGKRKGGILIEISQLSYTLNELD